ncbi:hypothetical protein [Dyadobacter luticola]|uniref:HEPN domain-containing protein n=1 Tax=Dyadobacter luticola TaxID=1979387 RepID=A0A5R9L1V0_9BACT|nr:hypothetical protein [Dyadobacter luticola]TLV02526.1 hypothetical protein FEN17_02575 [Dyadobacter luticola]
MATTLLVKYKENFESAQILIDHAKWNSSVHCSYYGCLQYIKELLYKLKSKRVIDQSLKNNSASTHLLLINSLMSELVGKLYRDNIALSVDINTALSDLKQIREVADYTPDLIDEVTSRRAQESAFEIVNCLENIYKLSI